MHISKHEWEKEPFTICSGHYIPKIKDQWTLFNFGGNHTIFKSFCPDPVRRLHLLAAVRRPHLLVAVRRLHLLVAVRRLYRLMGYRHTWTCHQRSGWGALDKLRCSPNNDLETCMLQLQALPRMESKLQVQKHLINLTNLITINKEEQRWKLTRGKAQKEQERNLQWSLPIFQYQDQWGTWVVVWANT